MNYKKDNLQIIKNFIEDDFIELIQDYFSIKINSNNFDNNTESFLNGYSFYGDPLMETLLQNSCECISELIDVKIVPTYSLTNMFMKDDFYTNCLDDSSEISAILFLGSSDSDFSIEFNDKIKLILSKGDLVVFNNRKIQTKKNIIKNRWTLQTTFNFVDSEGNYKNNIYDNRPYLGFPISSRIIET
jgi:hypothetical protein